MEVVKKTQRYTIFKKRSGRYGVRSAGGAWINGDDKRAILIEEGLIKAPVAKKPEETPAESEADEAAPVQDDSEQEQETSASQQ